MLNYSTLTNQSSLENVDSIQVKTLTTEELYVQGVSKNQPLVSNSVGKITTAPLTDGQLIIGNTSTSSYNAATLTPSSNILVANSSGSISIGTSMTPTFTTVTTNNLYCGNSNLPIVSYLGKYVPQPLLDGQIIIGKASTSSYNAATLTASSNIVVANGSGSISIATSQTPTFTRVQTLNTYTVDSSMTTAAIQAVISNVAYNVIEFSTGTYAMTAMLNINRSNLVIKGNQAILKLNKYINAPVVFIGDITTNPPTIYYENITIKDLHIDGNKGFQSSETSYPQTWIYNNCIGMNLVSMVVIQGCRLDNARSGGMTITYSSNHVIVKDCFASGNYFDGFTAYGSQNLSFQGCQAFSHYNGAGFSIDLNCSNVSISGNVCSGNKLALFARYCHDFNLTGNVFSGNTEQGLFIAGNYDGTTIGPNTRWTISSNVITNNGSEGLFLQSCSYFSISSNTITNNRSGIRLESDNSTHGMCSYNVISSNTIMNTTESINCGTLNTYSAGARYNILTMNTLSSIIGNTTACQIDHVGHKETFKSINTLYTESTSYVNTGLSITIIPKFASSKIKLCISTSVGYSGTGYGLISIFRGETDLSTDGWGFQTIYPPVSIPLNLAWTDSPATTSSLTYSLRFKINNAITSGSLTWNVLTQDAYIEAEEIYS